MPGGVTVSGRVEVWLEGDAAAPQGGAQAAPGQAAQLRVHVRNLGDQPCAVLVGVIGLDPAWGGTPRRLESLAPGEPAVAIVSVTPPAGSAAGSYPLVVSAQPLDATGLPAGAAIQIDGTVVVGDTSRLAVTLAPAEPRGVRGRKVTIDLDNRGTVPLDVELAAAPSAGLRIRLRETTPRLAAGERASVGARLFVQRPRLFGQTRRIPFVLTAQGRTTPVRLDGVFVARPMFGRVATRALALAMVIALWATAAVIGVGKISSRAHRHQQVVAAVASGTAPGGSGGPSQSPASGGSGGGGAGGSGGSGGSVGSGGAAGAASTTSTARVNGTVTGPAPGGVTVTLSPTSLVDEVAQGATFVGVSAPTGPLGKVPAELVSFSKPLTAASTTLSTQTQPDGSWAFAGVHAPGYYLLTFTKAGYQTKRYVISPVPGADPTPLTVAVTAGDGQLSGGVVGADGGPLGGVAITITDGTTTVATSTPTTGDVGHWSVAGISTPGTYLVSASRNGYGTESRLVTLPAGGSLDNVDLTLHAGVESLVGTVSAPDDAGNVAGIGGVTVSVTNGTITRTATTVTTGPVGRYALPQLPVPSAYTVTISGAGFATRTAQVTLTGDAPDDTVDALLSLSTATVTGTITSSAGGGLVGAGIVLSGQNGVYKTTTVSDPAGAFRITGVVPGSYVLSAEKFGQVTKYAQVEVTIGTPANVDLTLAVVAGEGLPTTAHIRGRVTDSRTGGQISCAPSIPAASCVITATTIDRRSTGAVTLTSAPTPPDQEYVLPAVDPANSSQGLLPGLHTVTISAPGYEAATVMVQVPLGATVEAPPVALAPAATLTGTLTSPVGALPAGTCVIVVPLAEGGGSAPPCTPAAPPATTCTTTIADALCAVADANGIYTVAGISHGSYYVYVEPTDPEYLPVAPIQVTLASGQTAQYNASVNRLGRLSVTVLKPDSNGTPVAAPGEAVTATPGSITSAPTDVNGVTLITKLASGTYTLTVTDGVQTATATASVGLNQTIAVSTVLTQKIGTIRAQVVYAMDGSDQPVPGASVFLTGVVGYSGTSAYRWGVSVVPDSNGCFVISDDGTSPAADGGSGLCDGANLPVAYLPLVTANVDASVTATGFPASSQTGITITPGSLLPIVIQPPGRLVSGTIAISPAPSGSVDLSQATVQVTAAAPGSGQLSLKSDAAGAITWTDSAEGSVSSVARPGTYTVRASLPGYDDAVSTFTVPMATDGSTFSFGLTLTPYGALTINAVDSNSAAVPDAVYILTGTGISATTLTAPPGGSSVTFPNLSSKISDYKVTVRAAGYIFTTSSSLAVSAGVTSSYDVTLSSDGGVAGTVYGSASGQSFTLAGVTVTATKSGQTFTAVTDRNGVYRVTGTTVAQGLDAGTWTVSVKSTGYNGGAAMTASVVVAAGADTPQDFTLPADKVNLTVTVQDDQSKAVTTATVTLQNSSVGPLSPSSQSSDKYTFSNIDPTQYSLNVTAANYAPLSISVTLQPGVANQTVFVTLATRTNSIAGTIKGQRGSDPAVALAGASVQALDTSNNPVGTAVTTDSSGQYQLEGLPDGTYKVQVTATGYAPVTSSKIPLKSGQVATFDTTLTFYSHQLTVTVTSNSGSCMNGAEVTLTADPTSTGESQSAQPATSACPADATVVFNQVLAGKYTIKTSGPTGHLDGSTTVTLPNDSTAQAATVTVAEEVLKITVTASPANVALSTTVTVTPTGGSSVDYPNITANGTEHDVYVDPTNTYTVTASASGYVDGTFTTTAGGTSVPVALTVTQDGSMTVTVKSSAGVVSGATVTLSGGPSSPGPLTSDASGVAAFTGLAPGTYAATATTSGATPLTGSTTGQTVTSANDTPVTVTVK